MAKNCMGCDRILAKSPFLPDYSFDDIHTTSFTNLLSAQIAEWLVCMSSGTSNQPPIESTDCQKRAHTGTAVRFHNMSEAPIVSHASPSPPRPALTTHRTGSCSAGPAPVSKK
jgi:hypothetical protein